MAHVSAFDPYATVANFRCRAGQQCLELRRRWAHAAALAILTRLQVTVSAEAFCPAIVE